MLQYKLIRQNVKSIDASRALKDKSTRST